MFFEKNPPGTRRSQCWLRTLRLLDVRCDIWRIPVRPLLRSEEVEVKASQSQGLIVKWSLVAHANARLILSSWLLQSNQDQARQFWLSPAPKRVYLVGAPRPPISLGHRHHRSPSFYDDVRHTMEASRPTGSVSQQSSESIQRGGRSSTMCMEIQRDTGRSRCLR